MPCAVFGFLVGNEYALRLTRFSPGFSEFMYGDLSM